MSPELKALENELARLSELKGKLKLQFESIIVLHAKTKRMYDRLFQEEIAGQKRLDTK